MERINTANKAVDLFGAGKHGFQDGDPTGGILATLLAATWFNSIQEELAKVVEQAGLTLNPADRTQLLQALSILVSPSGKIDWFARSTPPVAWIKANGAAVSRTTYAGLFAAIGTTYGAGDGSTTFNVPDLRGEFIRGWDDSRGVDTGRTFGSLQKASLVPYDPDPSALDPVALQQPAGQTIDQAFGLDTALGGTYSANNAKFHTPGGSGTTTTAYGGTRPRNVALLACIKT